MNFIFGSDGIDSNCEFPILLIHVTTLFYVDKLCKENDIFKRKNNKELFSFGGRKIL
jgi:hypothetical protein